MSFANVVTEFTNTVEITQSLATSAAHGATQGRKAVEGTLVHDAEIHRIVSPQDSGGPALPSCRSPAEEHRAASVSLALRMMTAKFFGTGALTFAASIASRRVCPAGRCPRRDWAGRRVGRSRVIGCPVDRGERDRAVAGAHALTASPCATSRWPGHKGAASLASRRGRRASGHWPALGVGGDTLLASRAGILWHLHPARSAAAARTSRLACGTSTRTRSAQGRPGPADGVSTVAPAVVIFLHEKRLEHLVGNAGVDSSSARSYFSNLGADKRARQQM